MKYISDKSQIILLFILSASLLFTALDKRAMHINAEARTFLVARHMMDSGDWMVPVMQGDLRLEKPPLYYWMICLTSLFSTGKVTDFTARFPSALSGVIVVLLVFFWTKEFMRRSKGDDKKPAPFIASALTLCSPLFLRYSRFSDIDMVLTMCTTIAGYCFWKAMSIKEDDNTKSPIAFWLIGYFFVGLAVLDKGPIGIMVPILPLAVISIRNSPRSWKCRVHLMGWLVILAVALPWPLYIMNVVGSEGSGTFWEEIAMRFTSRGTHAGPFYIYLLAILGMLTILAFALPWAIVRWWKENKSPSDRYIMWTFLANLALLCVFSSKRDKYMLPLLPSMVLMLSWWIVQPKASTRILNRVLWIAIGFITILGLALTIFLPSRIFGLGIPVIIMAVFLIHRKMSKPSLTLISMIWLCLIYLGAMSYFFEMEPRLAYYNGERPFARQITNILSSKADVYMYGKPDPVLVSYLPYKFKEVGDPADISTVKDGEKYLIADRDFQTLDEHPDLHLILAKMDNKHPGKEFAVYEILKANSPQPLLHDEPLDLLIVNGAWHEKDSLFKISRQITDIEKKKKIGGIILTEDPFVSVERIRTYNIWARFERPYLDLLEKGIPFYAALAKHNPAFVEYMEKYPPLNMQGRNYNHFILRKGLCDLFVLDSNQFLRGTASKQREQLNWLKEELEHSKAVYKMMVMHDTPLDNQNFSDPEIQKEFLSLLKQYEIRFVFSGSGRFYERIENNDGHICLFDLGSGKNRIPLNDETNFVTKSLYDESYAVLYLEIDMKKVRFRTMDQEGIVIDTGVTSVSGKPSQGSFPSK